MNLCQTLNSNGRQYNNHNNMNLCQNLKSNGRQYNKNNMNHSSVKP